MDDIGKYQLEDILNSAPGGAVKLALDDVLTILYAPVTFYTLVKNVMDKTKALTALLRIVYSADVISVTQQLAAQKHRVDGGISFRFRVLQPDGSFKWILISGNRIQEIHQSGNKSFAVYSCIAVDITDFMSQYKLLEQKVDYNNKITELSRDLYFEYDIMADTLYFTELFHEIFGKDAIIKGFRDKLKKTKLIHPEEHAAVVKIYESIMGGRKQVRFEMRLIPKDGVPIWYICYASIIFDDNRNPYKMVGKLSTMNTAAKEPETAAYLPVMDSLTNVCTKESAELMIKESVKELNPEALTAFMLIDIRNYKNINEIRRSLNGENILTVIGRRLKEQLRTTDIIGRVGLSEFAVYLKDLPSDRMAYEQAEKLCKSLESVHSFEHTKNSITVSIGMTLQRGEQEYQTMLTNANAALVMARKIPASSFEVFSGTISG